MSLERRGPSVSRALSSTALEVQRYPSSGVHGRGGGGRGYFTDEALNLGDFYLYLMSEDDSEDCCRGVVGGADRAVVVGVRGPPGPAVGGVHGPALGRGSGVRAKLVAQGAGDLDVELRGPVPTGAQVGTVSPHGWRARLEGPGDNVCPGRDCTVS